MMIRKSVNLYFDDTSIRLLVLEGRKVSKWGDVKLESGLIQNNVIVDENRVAEEICRLLIKHDVKANKANIGISGLGCLTRPALFPLLPKEVLSEAIEREAARVLPVPLEQLYLSWQVIPSAQESTEAFITAIPRKIMNPLDRTLKLANIKYQFLGLKPLLQASAVEENTSIVVDIQLNEFDIVIISEGKPQPVRTMAFPETSGLWEDKLSLITDELERTISFFNANNQENPLSIDIPLFVSGAVPEENAAYGFLSERLGRPVKQLMSPLECPENMGQQYYSVILSMAYQQLRSKKEPGSLVIGINVLPAALRVKTISISNILPVPAAVILLGGLLFLVLMTQHVSSENKSLQAGIISSNLALVQGQAHSQEIAMRIQDMQESNDTALTLITDLSETLGYLEGRSMKINEYIESAVAGTKAAIRLDYLQYTGEKLTITGTSQDVLRILSYLRTLHTSDLFQDIESLRIFTGDDQNIGFSLTPGSAADGKGYYVIDTILSILPETVGITDLEYSDNRVTMSGQAPEEQTVISYLNALSASGYYSEIHILTMIPGETGSLAFSLIITPGD